MSNPPSAPAVAAHRDAPAVRRVGGPPDRSVFDALVARLSRQSVDKRHDAYGDVAWDDPEMAIDPTDPRFELPEWDCVAHTDWYRSSTAEVRARYGLHRLAAAMKIGGEFENVLQRGLLLHAFWLPNGASEFRYMHHEVIEESQHTLMFQEFINRTGMDVRGMRRDEKLAAGIAVRCAKARPAWFFMFVLGGEDPVDHLQRRTLSGRGTHPLAERIIRIHLAEEARHLSFARSQLQQTVPGLSSMQRHSLALFAPVLYGVMARMMVLPRSRMLREFGVPRAQVRAAARRPEQRSVLVASVAKTRRTCIDLGLMTSPAKVLWKAFGIWDEASGQWAASHSSPRRNSSSI